MNDNEANNKQKHPEGPLDMADPTWMKATQEQVDKDLQEAWFPSTEQQSKDKPK